MLLSGLGYYFQGLGIAFRAWVFVSGLGYCFQDLGICFRAWVLLSGLGCLNAGTSAKVQTLSGRGQPLNFTLSFIRKIRGLMYKGKYGAVVGLNKPIA